MERVIEKVCVGRLVGLLEEGKAGLEEAYGHGKFGLQAGEGIGGSVSGGRAVFRSGEFWQYVLLQQRSPGMVDSYFTNFSKVILLYPLPSPSANVAAIVLIWRTRFARRPPCWCAVFFFLGSSFSAT